MKAIRVHQFGDPDVLELDKGLHVPSAYDTEVLVKVEVAGINPVDTYVRSGTFAYGKTPDLPYIPGTDGAGRVHLIGPNVTKFKEGDRVYFFKSKTGSYADFTIAEEANMGILPDDVSFEQGAGIGVPYCTAIRAMVERGQAKRGQTLLVHGASGGVGLACVQLGRHLGMTVFATAGSQTGMDIVRSIGADYVFNHRKVDYMDEIQHLASEDGVNLVIEMLADVNLQHDIDLVSSWGTVVIVGAQSSAEIIPRTIMAKEVIVTGVNGLIPTQAEFRALNTFIEDGLTTGWLRPHTGQAFDLIDASHAHVDIMGSTPTHGKMILKI